MPGMIASLAGIRHLKCRRRSATVASWTPRGVTTMLDEHRPVQVFRDGSWYVG